MKARPYIVLICGLAAVAAIATVYLVARSTQQEKMSKTAYVRSLVAEVRKVQEGGNWIRIGTNDWFYFIGITDHAADIESNGYGKINGDFIIRPYPTPKLSGIAIGVDSQGRVFFSQGVCAMTRWPGYKTRSYETFQDFMAAGVNWQPLPTEYDSRLAQ